jgi:hypothetical protein
MFYIGSTTQELHQRLAGHRKDYKIWLKNNIKNMTSFEILKFDDHYIELLEIFACNSKKELNKREGQYIRSQDKCINKRIAGRTKQEYYADNLLKKLEYQKKYYAEHQEQMSEYQTQYRPNNKEKLSKKHTCECGGKYTTASKTTHFKTIIHQTHLENNKSII